MLLRGCRRVQTALTSLGRCWTLSPTPRGRRQGLGMGLPRSTGETHLINEAQLCGAFGYRRV
jgi:hypothetical protein